MKKLLLATVTITCCWIITSGVASAKTLILEGKLDGSVAMRQAMEFSVNKGVVSSFSFRFALPASFRTRTVSQSIDGFAATLTPRPSSSTVETDRFGNRFQKVTWENVDQDIRVRLDYTATIHTELTGLESSAPFPLGSKATAEGSYLKASDMVQSNSSEIIGLARQLTRSAKSEYEAVMSVTNWVADNIKYTFNPPHYDAGYTLVTKSGNCQNFAHLSIALLRSVGIPARIVGGITLKDSWKVPIDARNSIVQSMGQGGHAWLEVWFPDLGWLPYDPQQSKQFTSTRHIKQSHGIDSRDINDTWRGGPYLPAYSEMIEGRFTTDTINLKMKRFDTLPRPYLLSNMISAATGGAPEPGEGSPVQPPPRTAGATTKPMLPATGSGAGPAETRFEAIDGPTATDDNGEVRYPPVKPARPPVGTKPTKPVKPAKPVQTAKPPAEPVHKKPVSGTRLIFGNMDFPALVNLYNVKGDTGTRVFERETSEYVTSNYIYAQAFQVKDRMSLERISLAMHKFGGDGSVYLDLVKDKDGRPDIMQGIRSNLLDLEKVPRNKPGYYWVDFSFPPDGHKPQQLTPGKYWIVFRASGEAIMNWFLPPANRIVVVMIPVPQPRGSSGKIF